MEWILKQTRVYFGNANTVKDFRVQLRGNKSIWFWFSYLAFLSFFAIFMYSSAEISGVQSISSIQQNLKGFYTMMVQTLQTVILLVAPILSAQGLIAEFERQSMDLVMSAPVTPKYFFVGKLLSGMRQLMLLLFLSLPVSSLGVIMGGATWNDVFVTYYHLFLQGSLIMAFSLPVAMMTMKMAPTVAYVMMAIVCTGMLSGITMAFISSGMSASFSLPFYAGLLPYVAAMAPSDVTRVFGIDIPNFLLATLLAGLLIKMCLLGAGSVISKAGSAETQSLRIHGLLTFLGLGLLIVWSLPPAFWMTMSPASRATIPLVASLVGFSMVAEFLLSLLLLIVAHTSCFSYTGEKKHQATSWFGIKDFLSGRPGGGLPYLLACFTLLFGPFWVVSVIKGADFAVIGAAFGWALAYLIFCWSLAWSTSALSKSISVARRGFVGLVVVVMVIPGMLLAMLQGAAIITLLDSPTLIMELNPFHPFASSLILFFAKIVVLLGLALFIGRWAEGRRMRLAVHAGVNS